YDQVNRITSAGTSPTVLSCRDGSSGARYAVHLVVDEVLGAGAVEIVRNGVNVASAPKGHGIHKTVGDVDGVATGGRGFEFLGLQAVVINVSEVEAVEGGSLADGERVEGAL